MTSRKHLLENIKKTSLGRIVFWFVVFWPVGIVLFIARSTFGRIISLNDTKKASVLSFFLIGFSLLYLLLAVYSEGYWYLAAGTAALAIGGALLLILALKTKAAGQRYKKCIGLILNSNETQFDRIASTVNVSRKAVIKDLSKMIELGFFPGAVLDIDQGAIKLPRK